MRKLFDWFSKLSAISIAMIVVAVLLLLYAGMAAWWRGSESVAAPGHWAFGSALKTVDWRGKYAQHLDYFPDRDGKQVPGCVFAIREHSLVYWSPSDVAFCIATRGQRARWVSVRSALPPKFDVRSIYTSRSRIYLNIHDGGGSRKVVCYDLAARALSLVTAVDEVRAYDNSDDVLALCQNDAIELLSGGQTTTMRFPVRQKVEIWDGDPACKMACWIDAGDWDELMFINNRGKIIRVGLSGVESSILPMCVCPKVRAIWMPSIPPIPDVVRLGVYNYEGRYLGNGPMISMPASTPMYSFDPVVEEIAHKLSQSVKP